MGSIIGKVGVQFCSVYSPQLEPQPWLRGDYIGILVFCLPQKGETVKRIREQVKMGSGEEPRALMLKGREVAILSSDSSRLG